MPFTIKTVYTNTYDIRRFYVDGVITFEELKERIGQIYGGEDMSDASICYVDLDNDFIQIKTSDDIGVGMDLYKDKGVLKVFVCKSRKESEKEKECESKEGKSKEKEGEGKCGCGKKREGSETSESEEGERRGGWWRGRKCGREGESCDKGIFGRRKFKEGRERLMEIMKRRKMVMGYVMSKFCGKCERNEKRLGEEGEKEGEGSCDGKRFLFRRMMGLGIGGGDHGCGRRCGRFGFGGFGGRMGFGMGGGHHGWGMGGRHHGGGMGCGGFGMRGFGGHKWGMGDRKSVV
jgi:hypothetical protein